MTSDDPRLTPLDRLRRVRRELDAIQDEIAQATADAVPGPTDADGVAALETLANGLLWQRAIIAEHFTPALCSDPASNMLLFLYAAGDASLPTTGACCDAARVPRTTALRWLGILEGEGLVQSIVDPDDRRRTTIGLTQAGRDRMRACLDAIARAPQGGLSR